MAVFKKLKEPGYACENIKCRCGGVFRYDTRMFRVRFVWSDIISGMTVFWKLKEESFCFTNLYRNLFNTYYRDRLVLHNFKFVTLIGNIS
jgi:hypothetical protein